MTWLVSHQHNGAPKTTSHTTEHAAEVEVRRVAASLPLGARVVFWEIDDEGAEACGEPAGRLAGVEVGPSYADGITGRNGTIQGDRA